MDDKGKLKRAIADYMQSEGCDCCSNTDAHKEHKKILAEMLGVPKYSDGSGYNFKRFATKPVS
jgi:hypothetical protein